MTGRQRRQRPRRQDVLLDEVTARTAPSGVAAAQIAADADDGDARPLLRWFPRVTLALSAFIMSLVVTLISAYYALQGPEVLVRPPQQVLLYRDGEGAQSILAFGLRLDMINTAADYGDVMLEAALAPRGLDATFAFGSLTRPVFLGSGAAPAGCDLGSRCVNLPGLQLIEQPDALVDLPGGSARAMHLGFPATEWNCKGAGCARFSNFDRASAAVAGQAIDLAITLKFHRDGERTVHCRGGKVDAAYLRKLGWMTLACTERRVTGGKWL